MELEEGLNHKNLLYATLPSVSARGISRGVFTTWIHDLPFLQRVFSRLESMTSWSRVWEKTKNSNCLHIIIKLVLQRWNPMQLVCTFMSLKNWLMYSNLVFLILKFLGPFLLNLIVYYKSIIFFMCCIAPLLQLSLERSKFSILKSVKWRQTERDVAF